MSTNDTTQQHASNLPATQGLLPATTQEQQELLAGVLGDLGTPVLHNFTGDRMTIWKLTSKATGPDVLGFADLQGEAINLKHFYVHRVMVHSTTGQGEVPAIRCVLIDNGGKSYAFVSDGVARDLANIINMFGFGPYNGELWVHVVEVPTKPPRKTYRLMPVD